MEACGALIVWGVIRLSFTLKQAVGDGSTAGGLRYLRVILSEEQTELCLAYHAYHFMSTP